MTQFSFQYRAVDPRGMQTQGVIRAGNKQDAYRRVAATGVTPTKIFEERDSGGSLFSRMRSRVKPQEIAHFTYQLSVLLEARLPNLVVTPHVAWAARESRQRALDEVVANIRAFLSGESRNRVA